MTPTPERALELAKELTSSSVILGCLPESTSHYGGVYVIDDVERDRIVEALDAAAAIVNHYAEIAPKWRAVLEAVKRGQGEPVGIIVRESYGNSAALNGPGDALPVGAALYTSAPQPAAAIDELVCKMCGGNGFVDDGEIDCSEGGIPFENGPVKCVKDCPACAKLNAQPAPAFCTGCGERFNLCDKPAPAVTDISKMARILSDRNADACGVNRDDQWLVYGQNFIDDVNAMIAAPEQPK